MSEFPHAHQFRQQGYCVINLASTAALELQRDALIMGMRAITNDASLTLENYHAAVSSEAEHERIQIELTARLRQQPHLRQLLLDNKDELTCLTGADMWAQRSPYLRIVRPGKSGDSIGYHRDTFYGGSPYEISLVIPFVELDAGSALRVQPRSHLIREADIPLIQTTSATVHKGSPRHQLGFLYAPKVIAPDFPLRLQPVPLRFGQVLAFSLATLHGTTYNTSSTTRWSSDLRIVNAFAPLDLSARPEYYAPLLDSPATAVAEAYLADSPRTD